MQVEAVAPLVLPSCVTTHQSSGLKHSFFAVEISNSYYFLFYLSINGIGYEAFIIKGLALGLSWVLTVPCLVVLLMASVT